MELKSGVLWLGIHLKIQALNGTDAKQVQFWEKTNNNKKISDDIWHHCVSFLHSSSTILPFTLFQGQQWEPGPMLRTVWIDFQSGKKATCRDKKQQHTINPADAINKMCLTQLDPKHKETHTRPHLQLQAPSRWTLNNFRLPFFWVAQSIYCPPPHPELHPPPVYIWGLPVELI